MSETTTLPPLPDPPSQERLLESRTLLEIISSEIYEARGRLELFSHSGYGAAHASRESDLRRKRELTSDEQAELDRLEAIGGRAAKSTAVIPFEAAGVLAVVCRDAITDADRIKTEAERMLALLPSVTPLAHLPPGGWRQVDEDRLAMYARRVDEIRERLSKPEADERERA